MKNLKITLLAAVLFGFAFSNLQNANAQNALEGVEINGVTWSTTNVGATTPEGYGNYYTWEEAKTACPNGWRLPTMKELEMFADYDLQEERVIDAEVPSTWETLNGKNGRHFTDKVTGNSIFIPAAVLRYLNEGNEGAVRYTGEYGYYWSSTEYNSASAYHFCFYSGNAGLDYGYNTVGHNVRCVAE